MSGCPNGCSQHHIANIGFYGASIKVGEHTIPAYVAHVGGNYEGGEVVYGTRLKVRLPAKRVPDAVERWVRMYEAERARRRGVQRLRRARRAPSASRTRSRDLALPVEFGLETMNTFIDWQRDAPVRGAAGRGRMRGLSDSPTVTDASRRPSSATTEPRLPVLLPEGGVGDPRRARCASRRDARVVTIDTGVLFPETLATWKAFEDRFGVHDRRRGRHQPDDRGPAPSTAAAPPKVAALERALAGADALDHRHPPRAGPDPRDAPSSSSATTSARRREVQPARVLDREGPLAARSTSATCPTTRCTTRATRRSAARRAPSRAPAARAAGPAPTRPSAGCTCLRPHGPARHRLRPRRRDPHRAHRHRRRLAHDAAADPRRRRPPVVAIGTDLAYGAVTKTARRLAPPARGHRRPRRVEVAGVRQRAGRGRSASCCSTRLEPRRDGRC